MADKAANPFIPKEWNWRDHFTPIDADSDDRPTLDANPHDLHQWLRDLLAQYRDRLPPMTDEQDQALWELLRTAAYCEARHQEKRDETLAAMGMRIRGRKAVSSRQQATAATYQKIRDAYAAAASQGRVATMEEMMTAGQCSRDTVYRALRPPVASTKKRRK
jgi:hypothetical protein